jgi:hypothetical protein
MASTPAMGNGPFEFTDGNGRHWSIPLTAFNFVGAQVVVDSAWQFLTNVQPAKSYLAYAVSVGAISPAPAPSPFPAMVIQAVTPGTGGNNIQVSVAISNVVTSPPTDDPTLTPFSLTVTETDTYASLTAATIQTALQNQGGLVQATSVDSTGSPLSASDSLTLTGPPGAPAQLEVHGSGSPSLVFTLVAKSSGADGESTQVTITPDISSPPSSGQETFKLVVSWTKTVTGITLATLDTLVNSQLGYQITVSKPNSGAYSVPAAGSSTLSGGAQGSNAAATLFTGN